MAQINIDSDDKADFEEFKEDSETQAEAFSRAMDIVRTFEGEPVDHEELARNLEQTLIPMTEISSFRGAKEALEKHGESE